MHKSLKFFRGKRVFVTGHTGFKGGWLCSVLHHLGASVYGYALPPNTEPNLYSAAGVEPLLAKSTIADIRDPAKLEGQIRAARPHVLFHLAAQPLVRLAYDMPSETFDTNLMGTVNFLEAIRKYSQPCIAVVITTDKVYQNNESRRPFKEGDMLGGHDPYSYSKACAELACQAYWKSYFLTSGQVKLSTCRSGNVIGGGDWSSDRLFPDMVRAAFEKKGKLFVRNPDSVRPWQHVLDPTVGYLMLSAAMGSKGSEFCSSWNFSPSLSGNKSVMDVLSAAKRRLPSLAFEIRKDSAKHEAASLRLNSSKAQVTLGWRPKLDFESSIGWAIDWYSEHYSGQDAAAFTKAQIAEYLSI